MKLEHASVTTEQEKHLFEKSVEYRVLSELRERFTKDSKHQAAIYIDDRLRVLANECDMLSKQKNLPSLSLPAVAGVSKIVWYWTHVAFPVFPKGDDRVKLIAGRQRKDGSIFWREAEFVKDYDKDGEVITFFELATGNTMVPDVWAYML